MDLSINKIKQNKQLNFKGVKGDFNSKNTQVFRFTTPSHKLDEKPYLEITFLEREKNKGFVNSNNYFPAQSLKIPFDNNNTIELPQDLFKENGFDAFAYKYVFVNSQNEERSAIDAFKRTKINGEEQNLIEIGDNYGVSPTGGSMYHAFIDSVGYNPNQIDEKTKNFIRTHANKLGGSIKGLTYLLKQGYFDSYKYIISTPDIGADPTSPHKYWPNNQYQCSNMDDFKEFNFELFKKGKGYVADGAFTSQSLQSPLVQHVIKWGEQSPFYYMLKAEDKIQLGILPENLEAYKNVGIRLINSPISSDYDKNKPTLMQFVDDRLLDDEQRNDTKKVIDKYGKTNPEDHYDSVGYQDTIHPFYFEIDNRDFDEKLSCFKGENYIMLKDLSTEEQQTLFNFAGGSIVDRFSAGNATYWDGNVDIVKMNLSNPNTANSKEMEGFESARNYLYGVATFWTEAIQSDILKRTAQLDEKEIEQIAKNFNITKSEYEEIKQNIKDGKSESLVLEQNKQTRDYVEEFPLQSIETSPELSAIFSEPEFQGELLKGKEEKITQYIDDIIDEAIPEQYAQNEEYKQYATKIYANEILKALYSEAILENSVNEKGEVDINKLRNEATLKSLTSQPTSVKIERNEVVSKIRNNLFNYDDEPVVKKITNELKDVTLEDFKLAESIMLQGRGGLNWRFDAARDIGDLASVKDDINGFQDIWNGSSQADGVQQFWGEFVSRIKQYNPGSYIVAEITNFGDPDFIKWLKFDSMMEYDEKLTNTFLTKLKNDIKETDSDNALKELADIFSDTSQPYEKRKYAFEMALDSINKSGTNDKYEALKEYENNIPWAKEQNFLEQIGATTSSNYDKYFNRVSYFVGVDPENADLSIANNNVGKLGYLKENTERLLKYNQPNTAILSHTFVDNHDKPRVLHALPLDMDLVITGLNLNVVGRNRDTLSQLSDDDERKAKIIEITGKEDLSQVNPMASAVGLMMSEKIKQADFLSDDEKEGLNKSLRKLVNGEKDGVDDARRARAFGFLPYEITCVDLFKGAGIEDEEKIEKFNKSIMETPMYLEDKIWQVLTGLIGVPTLYYGSEFAQTGYETFSKNDLVGNRNRALFERRYDGIYSKYYNKINATSDLSNNPKLSALRNGFPESLEIAKDDNFEMYPIYRKDERNSEVVSVITNFGIKQGIFSKNQNYKFGEELEPKKLNEIAIKNKEGKSPLEDGTKLKRMVYSPKDNKYVEEDIEYIVSNGSIKRADGKEIEINDTLVTFFTDKQKKSKYMTGYNGAH